MNSCFIRSWKKILFGNKNTHVLTSTSTRTSAGTRYRRCKTSTPKNTAMANPVESQLPFEIVTPMPARIAKDTYPRMIFQTGLSRAVSV